MTKVSDENKAIAKQIVASVGGSPSVKRFWDDDNKFSIDLLSLADRPTSEVTTFASLGLSDAPLYFKGKEYPAKIEILGCCESKHELFPNVISTAALNIIKDSWFCAPGVIFPDVVSMYYPEQAMEHLYFTTPFIWEDALSTMELPNKKVSFLLGIPISEQERRYAIEHSPVELENLFEKENINIFDLHRKSVL